MKKIFLIAALATLFAACSDHYTETVTYKINEPIIMSAADFRATVKVTAEKHKIENYGKICFYNGYLYIAENGKGIHIIDNRNPAAPQIAGFVELLGNFDMAIRNNTLYADMFVDLVWFDISNPAAPVAAGVLPNAFPASLPVCDNEYGYDYQQVYGVRERADSVIVGWKLTQRTEDVERYRGSWWNGIWGNEKMYDSTSPTANGGGSQGVNGSMSSFALYSNYLYSVMNSQMSIIALGGEQPAVVQNDIYIGYNVETLFNYKNAMFMGTPTGMLIYSLEKPTEPKYCSLVQHVYGCDPVVVEDDLAYVTVHSGNACGQNNNQLIIINVEDFYHPQEIVAYQMTHPKGLGIDSKTLFVCDDGLKIFRADNPQTIMANPLAHFSAMKGYDVIPFENTLMMIAEDGIYQYDYSDLQNITLISKLAFGQ
jgi:hypothetical protein